MPNFEPKILDILRVLLVYLCIKHNTFYLFVCDGFVYIKSTIPFFDFFTVFHGETYRQELLSLSNANHDIYNSTCGNIGILQHAKFLNEKCDVFQNPCLIVIFKTKDSLPELIQEERYFRP